MRNSDRAGPSDYPGMTAVSPRPSPRRSVQIIRLAELHVVDAKLREGPAVAAAQQFDHEFVLAARQRQAIFVGEIFRPHRQGQAHVVLQRANQIRVAARENSAT